MVYSIEQRKGSSSTSSKTARHSPIYKQKSLLIAPLTGEKRAPTGERACRQKKNRWHRWNLHWPKSKSKGKVAAQNVGSLPVEPLQSKEKDSKAGEYLALGWVGRSMVSTEQDEKAVKLQQQSSTQEATAFERIGRESS